MELIIKPTSACNFQCTFCSSPKLSKETSDKLDIRYIKQFLTRFPDTRSIIVNGGDPLMMPPSYYTEILGIALPINPEIQLALVTNLWDFYKKPEKWRALFQNKNVSVTTSFQYGDGRRITKEHVYTEDIFLKVMEKFTEVIGYTPEFIAVFDSDNLDRLVDTVRLAKKLGVRCKCNYANTSGRQKTSLPVSYIYEKYLDVYEQGLAEWESNTAQMLKVLRGIEVTCPLSRDCDTNIRALNPDGTYYSCGAMADDFEYAIDFKREVLGGEFFTPLKNNVHLESLKEECFSCPAFSICNGCKKHIKDLKADNLVESHCASMKTIIHRIVTVSTAYSEASREQ